MNVSQSFHVNCSSHLYLADPITQDQGLLLSLSKGFGEAADNFIVLIDS